LKPLQRRVILIEDNSVDSRLIEIFLQEDRIKFDLALFESLGTAAHHITENQFDIILLDLALPDSQGLDTFKRVKSMAPRKPIIILTSLDDREIADEAVRSGAQDYLIKGKFDSYMLKQAIRYAIERNHSEMAVIKSEERFRCMAEGIQDGLIIIEDNKIVYLNERVCDILGVRDRDLVKAGIFSYVSSEDREKVQQIAEDIERNGLRPKQVEFWIQRKDGSKRCIQNRYTWLNSEKESLDRYIMVTDITNQKLAEKTLIEQNIYNKIRAEILKEASKNTANNEDGIIQYILDIIGPEMDISHAMFFRFDQKKRAYIMEKQWQSDNYRIGLGEQFPYEVAQYFFNRSYTNLPQDLESIFSNNKIKHELKTQIRKKLKRLKIASTLLIPYGPVSNPDGFFGFSIEDEDREWSTLDRKVFLEVINTLSMAVAKMRAEREVFRLASVVQQASESIVITDLKGNIEYVNPTFEEITGYNFSEVSGKNPRILKTDQQDQMFYRNLWKTISSGHTWTGTFVNRRKDGSIFYEDAVIFPIKNNEGQMINYAAVKRDVTKEYKLAEQLRQAQKLEGIGQLAGGIAHDFNNILSVINGFSELALLSIDSNHRIYNNLRNISQAGTRASSLVRQLLAFSRKQIIKPIVVDINELMVGLEKMLRRLIGEDINMKLKLSKDIGYIKADPGQFEQILINLIVNARDAVNIHKNRASEKKIIIETKRVYLDETYVLAHPGSRTGYHTRVIISDTGIGMDEDTQRKIFDPFFTTKPEGEGTGLGLSTVYGIVKQNDGSIYVYSEQGKGTSFAINWPCIAAKQLGEKSIGSRENLVGGKETILLAEDEDAVRAFACETLNSLGYQVFEAANGLEAIELVRVNSPKIKLLISDVVMPEMGGKELVDKMKKLIPDIKVIFTSGYTDSHIVHSGVLDENINFLHKPYSVQVLAKKVREILDEN
jgi:PAS domain S-box-containing protein